MAKDIPIIFSGPMVHALLEGRKTMTRRIVSLQNCEFGSISAGKLSKLFWEHAGWDKAWTDRGFPDAHGVYTSGYLHVPCHDDDDPTNACDLCDDRGWSTTSHRLRPKIQVGDHLWVREAVAHIDNSEFGQDNYWQYRADTGGCCFPGDWPPETKDDPDRPRWRPSIHMPREASRLTLIVTSVKVKRLQDISREDAIAEGATMRPKCYGFRDQSDGWSMDWSAVGGFSKYASDGPGPLQERDICFADPRNAFGSFLNEIHGGPRWNMPGKPMPIWDVNPFVVAITFRVIKANIDAPEARAAA